MARRPAGFRSWGTTAGYVFSRLEEDGRWVILAGPPDVKLDNKHGDRRPHLHAGGWESTDRRELRADLTMEEAVSAIRVRLTIAGHVDAHELQEALR